MLLGIMRGQCVSCVEDFVTNDAMVGETKVDLSVSFNALFCFKKFSTGEATKLAGIFMLSHKCLDQGIQI